MTAKSGNLFPDKIMRKKNYGCGRSIASTNSAATPRTKP
jgi:hypothetical protein